MAQQVIIAHPTSLRLLDETKYINFDAQNFVSEIDFSKDFEKAPKGKPVIQA